MRFADFLIEAKKGKKEKHKHKAGAGLDRLISEVEGRIDALRDNWEPADFDAEIKPKIDKAGDLEKLSARDLVKLFLAVTRCYFHAKYPTSSDPFSAVKIAKEDKVDALLIQAAKDLAEFAQNKYPKNKELDELLTDYEYGYVDDLKTEALIYLITEIIAFVS